MNKTSRAYHHGDLRQTIIEAACEHLRVSGADTLSLRALARDVGVSQTAPYRHFDSKNALFAAVAVYGFTLLEVELRKASHRYEDDVELAIVEVGLAYVGWALANPEKYQLFFDSSLIEFGNFKELVEVGQRSFNVIESIIKQGICEGVLIDKPIDLLAGTIWASIHGIASLLISKSDVQLLDIESSVVNVIHRLNEDPRATLELLFNSIKKR